MTVLKLCLTSILKDFIKRYNLFDINTAQKYLGIVKERDFTPEEIQEIGGENTAQLLKDISRTFTELQVEENYYNNFEEIQYNALMQMAPLLKQICGSKQNETRIACFSESYDSPIMWGHYADSAKGFCIKRSFSISLCMSLCPIDNNRECEKSDSCVKSNCIKSGNHWLLPVIYCSQRPDFTQDIEEQLIQTIFQLLGMKADWSNYDLLTPLKFSCYKSIDWSYEREWRWIRTYCSDIIPDFSPISIGSISGLYLGEHISQADEIILKDYASLYKLPDGTNIPIYKMKSNLCTPSYKLTAERIK